MVLNSFLLLNKTLNQSALYANSSLWIQKIGALSNFLFSD
ncbi:hypothetical protein SASC598O02_012890 [Snodgrassella alvi SCGC AB-598-O02]|nr:hypothetical protein SASC598O02_012890 [Snodgrassella alvi SCGC AB-598-O02]